MNILIITECSARKSIEHKNQLIREDFEKKEDHVKKREAELEKDSIILKRKLSCPAGEMYIGQQFNLIRSGIAAAREAKNIKIDLHIISTGYGLIEENRTIYPYEVNFDNNSEYINKWAKNLKIPKIFRNLISKKYDLIILALSRNYLTACLINDEEDIFKSKTLLVGPTSNLRDGIANLYPLNTGLIIAQAIGGAGRGAIKGEITRIVLTYIANTEPNNRINVLNNILNKIIDINGENKGIIRLLQDMKDSI